VRWGSPELSEIDEYEKVNIEEASIYVHKAINCGEMTRIDALTGRDGTKLMLLGYVE
jgi:hypothetical protein